MRAREAVLRLGRSLPRGVWKPLAQLQHRGPIARRAMEILTRPMRHRDARIIGGPLAGVRINLGGSFLRFLTGDAEPEVQHALGELLKPGDVVFDVGANIGFFTILCSRLVGDGGRVYAFEPMPENADTLRHNIALNGLSNVTVVEKALSSSTGHAELFVSRWSAFHSLNVEGASKREHLGPQAGEPIAVETVTLDEFLAAGDVPAPDLVKVDVEGAELAVLQGMRHTLESVKPLLICELHGTNDDYRRFLSSVEYQAQVLDADSPRHNPDNAHTVAWQIEQTVPAGLLV